MVILIGTNAHISYIPGPGGPGHSSRDMAGNVHFADVTSPPLSPLKKLKVPAGQAHIFCTIPAMSQPPLAGLWCDNPRIVPAPMGRNLRYKTLYSPGYVTKGLALIITAFWTAIQCSICHLSGIFDISFVKN